MDSLNPHVALFASPGMGHLNPLAALAKRLFSQHGFHSTIFVASASAPSANAKSQLLHSLQLPSAISIVHLSPPDISAFVTPQTAVVSRIHIIVRESIPALRAAIAAMSPQPTVLVVEMFGTSAFPVAEELGIPKYVYIPTTAAYLALMVCVPTLHREVKGEYVDMQEPVRIPGCKPIRVEDLIDSMMDRKKDQYDCCVYMGSTLPLADGILINTWEDLEPRTLRALCEDAILRRIMPLPVYPVGPIVNSSGLPCDKPRADCLAWLDEQPVESVIYVSFGSGGTLSEKQLTELALGLESSGKRFLWVVLPPAGKDGAYFNAGSKGGDGGDGLSRYLPDGFLTRTQEVGLVVRMLVPQVEVLSHPSVGGFLSHCGWNSTLESMVNGVPMIAWPLYAEQRMNAAMLAEEVGVGLRTKELATKMVVGREEIEKLVRLTMGKEGEAMRRRMKEVKESGLRAVDEGGSSRNWLSNVAQQWKQIGYSKAKEGRGVGREISMELMNGHEQSGLDPNSFSCARDNPLKVSMLKESLTLDATFRKISQALDASFFFLLNRNPARVASSQLSSHKAMDLPNTNPNPQVALFSSPGIGHLIPLVALSKHLFSQHGFHSTIFVASIEASTTTAQSQLLHSLHLPSAIRIVYLSPPNISAFVTAQTAVVSRVSITVRESMPAFGDALAAMSPKPSVLIVEMFGTYTFPIAEELGIPKYVYIPTTAAFLALTVYVPTLHKEIEGEYVDMQEPVRVPSCKPIRAEDLVDPMMDRKNDQYDWYVYMGTTLPLADAILINTWEDLEPRELRALREDPILRRIMPLPVYPVGPIVISLDPPCDQSRAECMAWLDAQPLESVIYVSLGSGGTLSEEQLTELAFGLELSGKRFLWVVRPPAGIDGAFFNTLGGSADDEMSRYLPDGFLTRTRGVGIVVPLWAPQVEVLSHPSTGGFLSHCGWNSTLESMVNGVPMIAWPLYAEQRMNAAILEEELGVGVRTKELPTKRVVGREEIEKLVRFVMEKEGEEAPRRRMKEVKESGLRAVGEGGSSRDWLSHVVQQWKISYAKAKARERREEGEIDGAHEWS
ncbi:uncharacterized protein LOC122065416 [Macadamia integrifolia]|uniref:uncharacterized protein LOC122065416 n=1 Tax=Macadamia integrifolia TaxID=60698 RepID=UPI001C4EF345|nr:uncharacterized protein LOC122065416 [Macadamia integrifolia]